MNDHISFRLDYLTRIRLNQLATRKNQKLSETIRELIDKAVDGDLQTSQVDELKKHFPQFSGIDLPQLIYHIARASIAPVAALQMQDKQTGDQLNEQVKLAAEKLKIKILGGTHVQ